MKPVISFTRALTEAQVTTLREVLETHGFDFTEKQYCRYAAANGKVSVAVYDKGPKVLVQGKTTEEFVKFVLEPEVLGVAELGYEEVNQPEMFSPHFGIDESGKGDFFGPMMVAGAYVNATVARALMDAGVMDSKRITSDKRVRELAKTIRETEGISTHVLRLAPEKYNELYAKFGSVNFLLAWAHAEVIQVLKRHQPECPRTLSDQFAHESVLARALARKKLEITLEQRTKGESDIAVAAASILARESFIDWMDECGRRLGFELPRGANEMVKAAGRRLIAERGESALPKAAKMHFRTSYEVRGLEPPPRKEWE